MVNGSATNGRYPADSVCFPDKFAITRVKVVLDEECEVEPYETPHPHVE